jgi:hypothetical protein
VRRSNVPRRVGWPPGSARFIGWVMMRRSLRGHPAFARKWGYIVT